MAKRKASRRGRPASGGVARARRQTPARKARPAARKAIAKKRPASRPARRKAATRRTAPKRAAIRRATRAKARPAKSRSATKAATLKGRRTAKLARKAVSPKAVARKAAKPQPKVVARTTAKVTRTDQAKRKHVLGLDRERRRVQGDEVVSPTPPSSLHLDRTASAARSGRQELRERYENHNETSPAMTGGDVDADWESAYAVGDEAPGGDNPTPDQNVVDDIGVAVGVEYNDNEELEGAARIEERDRHRWEFDPASSDDFDER